MDLSFYMDIRILKSIFIDMWIWNFMELDLEFHGAGFGISRMWIRLFKDVDLEFQGCRFGISWNFLEREGFSGLEIKKGLIVGSLGLDNVFHGRPDKSSGLSRIVGAFSRLFKDLLLYIVHTGFLLVTLKTDYFPKLR
jgi:hypothetical protein